MLEYLQGLFSLIFVLITVAVGIIIISKYIKVKKWEFLLIGLAWIGMPSGYYPDGINFIMIILNGKMLSSLTYLLVATVFLIPVSYLWLFVISYLINLNRRKLVLILFFVICIILEITLLSLLVIDPILIGTFINPFTVEFSLFTQVLMLFALVVFVGFGFLFTKVTLASKKPEIRLKGKFLLIAFMSFLVGAFLDIILPITPLTVVITRLILVSSTIVFYFGYILPSWVRKFLLKE